MNIERLEDRTLFSFSFALTNGTLFIVGSASTAAVDADQIELSQSGSTITATDIKTGAKQSTSGTVNGINIDLREGNDYVRMRKNDGTGAVQKLTSIFGGSGDDTMYGTDFNDTIIAGDGNDKLVGRGGSDILDGGAGFDTSDFSYESRAMSITLDNAANDGVIDVNSAVGGNQGEQDNVKTEAVIGGTGNDLIIGDSATNALDGNAGNDTMTGRGGNDTVTGGVGLDTIFGEDGNDFMFAKDGKLDAMNDGAGTDSAQIDSTAAGDVVTDVATNSAPPASPAILAALLRSAAITPFMAGDQPGDLDSTFADGGYSFDALPFTDYNISKVLLQSVDVGQGVFEKKILLIGDTGSSGSRDFLLARLNLDGSLDDSFGEDAGYTITDLSGSGSSDFAYSATIDAFGRIVVVGAVDGASISRDIGLARYDENGQLDTGFGNNPSVAGTTIEDYSDGGDETGRDIISTYNGEVVNYLVVGNQGNNGLSVGFDGGGFRGGDFTDATYTTSGLQQINHVVEDDNGRFWTIAKDEDEVSSKLIVRAMDSSGFVLTSTEYDPTDDSSFAYADYNGLIIDGNTLVVAGTHYEGDDAGFLLKFAIDTGVEPSATFDSFADVSAGSGIDLRFNAIASDGPGRAVAVGYSNEDSTTHSFAVYRFSTDTLAGDDTFTAIDSGINASSPNTTGLVLTTPVAGMSEASSIVIQPDGKIIAAGLNNQSNTIQGLVTRYTGGADLVEHSPSDLDPTFGANLDGLVVEGSNFTLQVEKVLTQGDKIVVVGSLANEFNSEDFFLTRFNADGSLDTTFGDNGVTLEDFTIPDSAFFQDDYAQDAAIDSNGRIIVVGSTQTATEGTNLDYAMARFDADGHLDTSFGGINADPGKAVYVRSSNFDDFIVGVVVQSSGGVDKYVILGQVGQAVPQTQVPDTYEELGRVNDDGNFDGSFRGNQGSLFSFVPGVYDRPIALTQDAQGNLWILTKAIDPSNGPTSIKLVAYNSEGQGLYGSNLLNFGSSWDYDPTALAIRGDQLVIAGSLFTDGPSAGALIAGTIDYDTVPGDVDLLNIVQDVVSDDFNSVSFDDVAFDADGRAVAVGQMGNSFAAYRFLTSDLSGDASFSQANVGSFVTPFFASSHAGLIYTPVGDYDFANAVTVQSDGKIVLAGTSQDGSSESERLALARYVGGGIAEEVITGDIPEETLRGDLTYPDENNPNLRNPLPWYIYNSFVAPTVGPITIDGTEFDDYISITRTLDESNNEILLVNVDGDFRTYDPKYATEVIVNGLGGTDAVQVYNTLGLGNEGVQLDLTVNGGENHLTFLAAATQDSEGNDRSISGVATPPAHGTAVINNQGNADPADDVLTYTPATNYFGSDSLTYTVSTSGGEVGQNVVFNLEQTNVAPTAGDDPLSAVDEDSGSRLITGSQMLGNDIAGPVGIEDAQVLKIVSLSNIVGGTATLLMGNVTFTPTANFNGTASYDYTVTDNGQSFGRDDQLTDVGHVSFSVTPVNDLPDVNAGGPYTVASGATLTLGASATDVETAANALVYKWDFDGDNVFGETSTTYGNENGAAAQFTATGLNAGTFNVKLQVFDGTDTVTVSPVAISITGAAPAETKLTGTVIGTTGSYQNRGNTRDKAFDGNLTTFFDAPENQKSGSWVGLDLGTAKKIVRVRFASRAGFESRMYGGKFQASNDKDFKTGVVDLWTVNTVPPSGSYSQQPVSVAGTFRYVRYLGPDGGYGNVAEVEFYTGQGDVTPPTKPGNLVPQQATNTTLTFTWGASTDAVGVARYDVFRDGQKVGATSGAQLLYTDTGLKPNTTYNYTVQAFDSAGNGSPVSNSLAYKTTVDVTPPSKPGKPSKVSATANTISITWGASTDNVGLLRYDIYRGNTKVGTSTTNSYTDTGLTPSTGYTYKVIAIDTSNNSSATSDVSGTISTSPAVPVKLTGAYIGTSGSYQNNGNVGTNAFDGNANTFFDGPTASGTWVGLDLGVPRTITQIRYTPRSGWNSRMNGGLFQASNDPAFATFTTLYTVSGTPANGSTTRNISVAGTFRYVRYIGPANGYSNIAEAEFWGY